MNLILSENRTLKFANFFSLYFLQGWIAGFTGTALINELASRGFSVGTLGSFAFVIGIPWIIQFIWSPLVDRFPSFAMGKRRTWLVGALVPANLLLALLYFIPFTTSALAVVFFANALLCSIMDVAVDGMTLDLVPKEETGLASSLTNAGSVLGGCVSALIFSWTLSHWSFSQCVTLLISVTALITLLPVLTRERREDRFFSLKRGESAPKRKLSLKKLALIFSRRLTCRPMLIVLGLSFAMNFAFSVIGLTFNAELIQKGGWSSFELSRYQSLLGFASGTIGAFAIGRLCDLFGYRRVLTLELLAMTAFFALMAVFPVGSSIAYLVILTVAPGFLFVSLVPAVMEVSRGAVAATLFTLCMTTMNFGSIFGAALSDRLFQLFTHATVFASVAVLFGAMFAALVIGSRVSILSKLVSRDDESKKRTYAIAETLKSAASPA